jgi:hypothetical protein
MIYVEYQRQILWKILNRYSGRGSKDPEVDLNTFFEYLKKLNAIDDNITNEHIDLNEECEAILNSEILRRRLKIILDC